MKKLENLSNDLFNKFEKDQINDLSQIKGGVNQARQIGQSGGMIVGNSYCRFDVGYTDTQELIKAWGCSSLD